MSLVIIDYGVGNLGSIVNMFRKSGVSAIVSSDRAMIAEATHLVLPGVGAFDHCVRQLNSSGARDVLEARVLGDRVPLLGICVGMQLFMERSEEGQESGLGWIPGNVVRFDATKLSARLKIPHMGWNYVSTGTPPSELSPSLIDASRFYFVHSYHVQCANDEHVWGRTTYGYEFASAIHAGNIFGVQFHPEKSHRYGCDLFRSFASVRS